ncbi:MAG: hypothetical protein BMS9Abin36_2283 [Gammaproteobacteria bacterium]|nr:MAG: hypothetical protein BMS9Abin36_2283 [Gammaproteobacteria bacterium]
MLKGIRDILKTMGEALSFANTGEMIPDEQKAEVMARHKRPFPIAPGAAPPRVVLAGDGELAPESMERAIALCRENNAMLDLLYVSSEGSSAAIHLATALPRLEAETDLDFQITRRQGDLLVVTENYLRVRQDTLMILVNVSESLRNRATSYQRMSRWARETKYPEVKLMAT